MIIYFGNNTLSTEDTTMNLIEKRIGRETGSIQTYKTYIIFCNDDKHYLGTDYIEFLCEDLPPVFPDTISKYRYVKLVCYNSG
jgi:hypothetical protein